MTLNILAIGDLVGEPSVDFLQGILPSLKQKHQVHLTIANGENISGMGLTPSQARSIFDTGVDVITLGNHTWNRIQICDFLDQRQDIIRPANYAGNLPGSGLTIWDTPQFGRVGIINLMGRLNLNPNLDSPFQVVDALLENHPCDLYVVDFHGEATSEKGAIAWYLDGRVSALWGTHTHVPTADTQILPQGTGFVTDLGMTGPVHSILGILPENSINLFTGGLPRKFQVATGPQKLGACLFSIDTATKKTVSVTRIDYTE